jgi:hypothetical protein
MAERVKVRNDRLPGSPEVTVTRANFEGNLKQKGWTKVGESPAKPAGDATAEAAAANVIDKGGK